MSARVESEPIRISFDPAVIEQKRTARAAFIAARDAREAAIWAEIAARREAAKTAHQWAEHRA